MKSLNFGIVTPTFNQAKFIRETIESVITQEGDFEISYFIVDGGSSDNTVEIISEYKTKLEENKFPIRCKAVHLNFISEPDEGMYDAIRKGFEKVEGEIQAWINSDDVYYDNTFKIVNEIFSHHKNISWLKGITDYINEESENISEGSFNLYDQNLLKSGVYGVFENFVQQDSVFWRSELYKKSGGIDPSFKAAGDFDLWVRFAWFAPLFSINHKFSKFRKWGEQKSSNIEKYFDDAKKTILSRNLISVLVKIALDQKSNFTYGNKARFTALNVVRRFSSIIRNFHIIEKRNGMWEEMVLRRIF